jgi:hypothetical protein
MVADLQAVTYQGIGVATGFLIVKQGQGDSVNIYNGDILNVLLVSPSPTPVLSNSIPIQPLTNATVSGKTAQYASALSGTCSQVTVSAASQMAPSPAQIAQQISALGLAKETTQVAQSTTIPAGMLQSGQGVTNEIAALLATGTPGGAPGGIPLLRFSNTVGSNAGVALSPVSSMQLFANQVILQPSYEAYFDCYLPAGVGTVPFCKIFFYWTDAATGDVIDTETFYIAEGNGPTNDIITYLSGPCRSNELTVFVENMDPAQTATLAWIIKQTSHVFTRDRLFQPTYATVSPNGQTNPAGNPSSGVICSTQSSITPLATSTHLMAAFSGIVKVNVNARGQANNISFMIQDPGTLYSTNANTPIWSVDTTAAGVAQLTQEVVLPNGPTQISVINRGSSGNVSPNVTVTKQEY